MLIHNLTRIKNRFTSTRFLANTHKEADNSDVEKAKDKIKPQSENSSIIILFSILGSESLYRQHE